MRRVCQTTPGDSACCLAAQQGLLGRPFRFRDRSGHERCGQCDTRPSQSRDPRKAGRMVFQFRFHKNAQCGIGPSGCAALAQPGTAGGPAIAATPSATPTSGSLFGIMPGTFPLR